MRVRRFWAVDLLRPYTVFTRDRGDGSWEVLLYDGHMPWHVTIVPTFRKAMDYCRRVAFAPEDGFPILAVGGVLEGPRPGFVPNLHNHPVVAVHRRAEGTRR